MNLLVDELIHFSLSLTAGLFFSFKFGNFWLLPPALVFGFFIDADHLFDYFAYYGAKFNLRKFFSAKTYIEKSGKVYVLLHGWEYVGIFWLMGRLVGIPGLEWAMGFSYFFHLLWDNFSFKHHPLVYFFIYRLLNNFSLESFNGQKV